ncbi:hypothetical protein EV424DRAFT_1603842 [Suillus variegatus]|nr:hypothetical protein EV424DRAFT_1603842 [Suillus variegatus]
MYGILFGPRNEIQEAVAEVDGAVMACLLSEAPQLLRWRCNGLLCTAHALSSLFYFGYLMMNAVSAHRSECSQDEHFTIRLFAGSHEPASKDVPIFVLALPETIPFLNLPWVRGKFFSDSDNAIYGVYDHDNDQSVNGSESILQTTWVERDSQAQPPKGHVDLSQLAKGSHINPHILITADYADRRRKLLNTCWPVALIRANITCCTEVSLISWLQRQGRDTLPASLYITASVLFGWVNTHDLIALLDVSLKEVAMQTQLRQEEERSCMAFHSRGGCLMEHRIHRAQMEVSLFSNGIANLSEELEMRGSSGSNKPGSAMKNVATWVDNMTYRAYTSASFAESGSLRINTSNDFEPMKSKTMDIFKSDMHILGLKKQRAQVEVDMFSEALARIAEFEGTDDVYDIEAFNLLSQPFNELTQGRRLGLERQDNHKEDSIEQVRLGWYK